MVVKPVAAAPGEGESVLLRPEDVAPAWQLAVSGASTTRVIAETVVEVDFEVTLLTVRTSGAAGPAVHFCEPIGHHQNDAEALESWQPQRLSPIALDSAKSIAARIVNSLGGRGVFAVELLVRGDEVYFSDVRPRLQDSGLVTLRSQRLSQFELHARAILGLPVDTIMISPGAVEVSYSDGEDKDVSGGEMHAVLADALAVAESDVRVFRAAEVTGDGDASWLSWSTATAQDPIVARDRARRVASAVRRLR
jgi:phosphoribosylglycinamide formyltransferase 2